MNIRADLPQDAWIDELERDLGQAAALRLLSNAGGQRRKIPMNVEGSNLAAELGSDIAAWLSANFAGLTIDIPSMRGRTQRAQGSALRAAILEAGLTDPKRSANVIAAEFGVTAIWVHRLRTKMRREFEQEDQLPLFDDLP